MYEIALTVAACLRSGTRVDVAWVVDSGLQPADPGGAVAITPGGGRVGSLYGGALDQQLTEQVQALGEDRGRLVTVTVNDLEAQVFGLSGGGAVRAVVLPAELLPEGIWQTFQDRAAIRVRLTRDGEEVTDATLEDPEGFDAGSQVDEREVTTTWRPVPTMVLAGGGPVLQALEQMAPMLGWRVRRTSEPDTARGLVVGLGPLDSVVLAMHDVEMAGPVLASALDGKAGYVGALGSTAMQQSRQTWLTDRGVVGLGRIHTPAGLDIGADGPAEVAVAILAEAIHTRTGAGQAKA